MQLYRLLLSSFFLLLCAQQDATAMSDAGTTVDTEMYEAIQASDLQKLSYLLSKGSSPDSLSPWGSTNLGFAVMENKMSVVELLLSKGANPNLKGDAGSSRPLIYAIAGRNFEMVQKLLAYKADPCIDRGPDSPIQFAQMILGYPSLHGDCHPIVDLLLKSREK